MAKVMFSGKMISDQIDAYLTNGVAVTDLKDGDLVALGDLVTDTTYNVNGYNAQLVEYDVYEAAAPASADDEVGIIDYAGISEGKINGNEYKIGKKLYNLTIPAGTNFRVRRFNTYDKFWIGEDNFESAPTVGEYAGATAGKTTFTPSATIPAAGLGVKILVEKDLTTGMRSNGKIYLVEVVSTAF